MTIERKKEMRRMVLAMRRSLGADEVERRSASVLKRLDDSGLLDGRETVALYAAADGEVLTRPLFERLKAEGRRPVLPRVRGRGPELDFFRVTDWEGLANSRLGIPEPSGDSEPVPPEEFDFVLVPGVAFDARGGRLGYGMGCYDRVLERTRPGIPLAGIGYDFQLVDEIPMEEHDARLTAVVIERGILLPSEEGGQLNIN
jgi:5-formyltetrahydrofolate cyclo-ligase